MKVTLGQKEYSTTVVVLCLILSMALIAALFGAIGYFGGKGDGFEEGVQSETARIAGDKLAAEVSETDVQLNDLKKQVSENEELLDEMKKYQEDKETLTADITDKAAQVEKLDGDIAAKQSELDRLTGDILQAKGAPISLPAGEYTGGTDFPAGRYSVSGSSNFVVHDIGGSLKVNVILGNSSIGIGTYTCTIAQGDRIRANSKVTFTPVG